VKRLAFFSPLNPMRTGVSDYSEALLPLLARWFDIDVFIDDYVPTSESVNRQFEIIHHREYERLLVVRSYAATLYHMGNSVFHNYIYKTLLRFAGVTVLHDLVLHHFFVERTVGDGDVCAYVRELAYAHGQAGAVLARDATLGRRPYPLFEVPLHERVVDASQSVIVHSRYAAQQLQKSRPDALVSQIPMLATLPHLAQESALPQSLRARWGIAREALVVASFGRIAPPKRIDSLLMAMARLQGEIPEMICLLVGAVAPLYDLAAVVQVSGMADRVISTGYLDPAEFRAAFAMADMAVNLRFPTAGETSASAMQLLGYGIPVLVSDIGAFSELPDTACIKIPTGDSEVDALETALRALALNSDLRQALRNSARSFVAEHHSPERIAEEYLEHFERTWSAQRNGRYMLSMPVETVSGLGLSPRSQVVRQAAAAAAELGLG
jgi:glycosyltransferase involved in cell wall biosynthesis